jgi:GNAT superfamily N-acetyltransferase
MVVAGARCPMVILAAADMKLVQWVRFTWDLDKLPSLGAGLPAHYSFSAPGPAEEKELRAVIGRSFADDTSWGDASHEVNGMLDGWLERAFEPERTALCLALRHGVRIIGAAIMVADPAADNHLSPGPCVLMEYRNRGLGTALLGESLRQLREAGLSRASALTKGNAPVAKFLYPKFNGVLTPDDTPLLAA